MLKRQWPWNQQKHIMFSRSYQYHVEGVVAQWCNPLTWKPGQKGKVGLMPSRTPLLEDHDKWLWTRLVLSYFCDPQYGSMADAHPRFLLVELLVAHLNDLQHKRSRAGCVHVPENLQL